MAVKLKTALENPDPVIEDYFRRFPMLSKIEDVAAVLAQDTIENILRTAMKNVKLKGFSDDEIDVEVYFSDSYIIVTFKLPTGRNIETRFVYDSVIAFGADRYKKYKQLCEEITRIKERVEKEIEIKNIEKQYGEYKELVKRYDELRKKYDMLTELVRQKLSEDEIIDFFLERKREQRVQEIRDEFSELFEDDDDDYDDC